MQVQVLKRSGLLLGIVFFLFLFSIFMIPEGSSNQDSTISVQNKAPMAVLDFAIDATLQEDTLDLENRWVVVWIYVRIHFDHNTRKCSIYEQRPRFCRVRPDIFESMYEIEAEEFDDFAIACCHQQIVGVYGKNSPELVNYRQIVD